MNQSGKFDKLIDIEKPGDVLPDGGGGWVAVDQEWDVLLQGVWANVKSLSGQRLLEFGAIAFVSAYEIRVYKDNAEGITDHCRILYNNKSLTIHRIEDEDEARNELVILAYSEAR